MATRDLPPGALGGMHVATLFAVMGLERPTVRKVAEAIHRCPAIVFRYLRDLRREGLVSWEDGRVGTLRATIGNVPIGGVADV